MTRRPTMQRFVDLARLVTIVLALCFAGAAHGVAAEVIHAFDSHVALAKDGTLTVTERIRVRA